MSHNAQLAADLADLSVPSMSVIALRNRAKFIKDRHIRPESMNTVDDLVQACRTAYEVALFEQAIARGKNGISYSRT